MKPGLFSTATFLLTGFELKIIVGVIVSPVAK